MAHEADVVATLRLVMEEGMLGGLPCDSKWRPRWVGVAGRKTEARPGSGDSMCQGPEVGEAWGPGTQGSWEGGGHQAHEATGL